MIFIIFQVCEIFACNFMRHTKPFYDESAVSFVEMGL